MTDLPQAYFSTKDNKLLNFFKTQGILPLKPCASPIDQSLKLSASNRIPLADPIIYRRLLGRLIYLTNSRPDICFDVQRLSQFIFKPLEPHYAAAIKLLRYLKSSPSKGILLSASSQIKLLAFADSDWARFPDTRRLVISFCVLLGSSLISWKSKKQHIIYRSSTEAEYRSFVSLTCELQ